MRNTVCGSIHSISDPLIAEDLLRAASGGELRGESIGLHKAYEGMVEVRLT